MTGQFIEIDRGKSAISACGLTMEQMTLSISHWEIVAYSKKTLIEVDI